MKPSRVFMIGEYRTGHRRQRLFGMAKRNPSSMLEDAEYVKQVVAHGLSIAEIVKWTEHYYHTDEKQLTKVIKGLQADRTPRKVAIYLSQQLSFHSLNEIKDYFELNHIGSVSFITSSTRVEVRKNLGFKREIEKVKSLIVEKMTRYFLHPLFADPLLRYFFRISRSF